MANLQTLPRPVLNEIMFFLDIKEVLLSFRCISRNFRDLTAASFSQHLKHALHIEKPMDLNKAEAAEIVKNLSSPAVLSFDGFATSGGVQDDLAYYWVANLYSADNSGYPSERGKYNINTAGVLEESLLSRMQPSIYQLRRYPSNRYILSKDLDVLGYNDAPIVFVATHAKFERPLRFTCPVRTFMIFVSTYYIDIEAEDFALFNDLWTLNEVANFCSKYSEYQVSSPQTGDCVTYVTFKWTAAPLKPLAWGRFEPGGSTCLIPLSEYFSGTYLYAKLIEPENRNVEFGFSPEDWNIDASYVGLKGYQLNLTKPPG